MDLREQAIDRISEAIKVRETLETAIQTRAVDYQKAYGPFHPGMVLVNPALRAKNRVKVLDYMPEVRTDSGTGRAAVDFNYQVVQVKKDGGVAEQTHMLRAEHLKEWKNGE